MTATDTMTVTDANSFRITLNRPFPLLLDVLGKPNAAVPFIMPERIIPATRGDRKGDRWLRPVRVPGGAMANRRHHGSDAQRALRPPG